MVYTWNLKCYYRTNENMFYLDEIKKTNKTWQPIFSILIVISQEWRTGKEVRKNNYNERPSLGKQVID